MEVETQEVGAAPGWLVGAAPAWLVGAAPGWLVGVAPAWLSWFAGIAADRDDGQGAEPMAFVIHLPASPAGLRRRRCAPAVPLPLPPPTPPCSAGPPPPAGGRAQRKGGGLVPLAPRLRLLAVGYRRGHPDDKPKVPGKPGHERRRCWCCRLPLMTNRKYRASKPGHERRWCLLPPLVLVLVLGLVLAAAAAAGAGAGAGAACGGSCGQRRGAAVRRAGQSAWA